MRYKKILEKRLWCFGVNKKYQGFDYIVYGMEVLLNNQNSLEYVTKNLYPDIAKKFNTSWKCVERDIRTIVKIIWKYGNRELLEKMNGSRMKVRPKNIEFFQILLKNISIVHKEIIEEKKDS